MGSQVFTAVCEILTNETDAIEVGPHCELFILDLRFLCRCTLLCQCLVVQCKGKNNVTSDFACVKLAVKASEFDSVVPVEKAVQVKEMVSA